MSDTTTIRTNLKLDRRWIGCANPRMCPAMADLVPETLRLVIDGQLANPLQRENDRSWLQSQLEHFTGPPNMELRTLDDDEIESPFDYYAVLLRIPMPNSNDPSTIFPVGRLGYTVTAWTRDSAQLKADVMRLFEALAIHETREWMRYDGEHVIDPHPES